MTTSVEGPLEKEIDAFMKQLPSMLKHHEGKWTVFVGDEKPLGFWDTRKTAFEEVIGRYGTAPFLMQQVSREYQEFGRYGRPVFYSHNFRPHQLPLDVISKIPLPIFSEIPHSAKNSNYFVSGV